MWLGRALEKDRQESCSDCGHALRSGRSDDTSWASAMTGRATDEEHRKFHDLHCCMSSLQLGIMMSDRPEIVATPEMLAEMRRDCPLCREAGWWGSEAFQ